MGTLLASALACAIFSARFPRARGPVTGLVMPLGFGSYRIDVDLGPLQCVGVFSGIPSARARALVTVRDSYPIV